MATDAALDEDVADRAATDDCADARDARGDSEVIRERNLHERDDRPAAYLWMLVDCRGDEDAAIALDFCTRKLRICAAAAAAAGFAVAVETRIEHLGTTSFSDSRSVGVVLFVVARDRRF